MKEWDFYDCQSEASGGEGVRGFWSYVTGGEFGIGCTGQSVYIYKNGCEAACLKGFRYTYKSCISPKLDYFALKSNTGMMYIYSLKDYSLVKKLRFMKTDCQDHMFTFSETGQELVSVDTYNTHTCISCYSVPALELKSRILDDSDIIEPMAIELQGGNIYALLEERNSQGIADKYFVARIQADMVTKKEISLEKFALYLGFSKLQADGFTEKAKAWSALRYVDCDLANIEKYQYSIADLYKGGQAC